MQNQNSNPKRGADASQVEAAALPTTSAAAVLGATFPPAMTRSEKVRAHSSWAIALIAVFSVVFFCGAVIFHGVVGKWPMGAGFAGGIVGGNAQQDDRAAGWGVR